MTEIDKTALRAKYRRERDKRLRPDGNDQYLPLTGSLLDDPHTPLTPREPVTDHVTVAFIGGGFAGLVTGARLKEAGVDDVRIVEKGGDFGGTWYWNRYPGAQCDTASFVYMPLLEETGHMPSEKYAHGPEILDHCRRIGKQYDLYANALLHTEVEDLTWDEAGSRWVVRTNRGDRFTARFVAMGTGPLHVPKLPGIPGLESYGGHSFHTSRWDYAYTGAALEHLADKRVAIIGTGATAVQCVPHLARACRELYVFQRTPPRSTSGTTGPPIPTGSPRSRRRGGSSAGWRTSPPTRRAARPTTTWSWTVGRTSPAGSVPGSSPCPPTGVTPRACWPPTRTLTSRRWRRSGPGSTRSSRIR